MNRIRVGHYRPHADGSLVRINDSTARVSRHGGMLEVRECMTAEPGDVFMWRREHPARLHPRTKWKDVPSLLRLWRAARRRSS